MPEDAPATPRYKRTLVWFRRDLRDFDHAALHHALRESEHVACVFVFDREILDALPDRADRRVEFIHASVFELQQALLARGGGLWILHGAARTEIPQLVLKLGADALYYNHDDDPAAVARDTVVTQALQARGVEVRSYKDHVVFERADVLSASGEPYRVYTPYRRAWLSRLGPHDLVPHEVDPYAQRLLPLSTPMPSLDALGFTSTDLATRGIPTGMRGGHALLDDFLERIDHYAARRDFPAERGPSYLSVHLRFGTVSIRALVGAALARAGTGAQTWLGELIWREFFHQILWQRPDLAAGHTFQRKYDALPWPNPPGHFAAWCEARTGYPLVDAAMRQLNDTGYMHNRVRMIAASFLTKDLLVDWRLGERYFAERLIDFDLAANSGGWQWAASVGCDAQPWFRIFNPVTQSQRFDPHGDFIRRHLPQLAVVSDRYIHAPWTMPTDEQRRVGVVVGRDYPAPIVAHAVQRLRALALFKSAA